MSASCAPNYIEWAKKAREIPSTTIELPRTSSATLMSKLLNRWTIAFLLAVYKPQYLLVLNFVASFK